MKKQTLFLMAGGLLALASCTSEGTGGYTDAYVDSVVNERVAQIQMELEEQNEARIHALALEKADSILAARAGKTTTTKKTTTSTSKGTTAAPEAPAKQDPPTSKSKWDNQKNSDQPSSKSKWENTEKSDQPSSKSKWGN